MALFGSTSPTGGGGFGRPPSTSSAHKSKSDDFGAKCPSLDFMAEFSDPPKNIKLEGEPGDPPRLPGDMRRDNDLRNAHPEWLAPSLHAPSWVGKYGCGTIATIMLNMYEHWDDLKKHTGEGVDNPVPGWDIMPSVMNYQIIQEIADCVKQKGKKRKLKGFPFITPSVTMGMWPIPREIWGDTTFVMWDQELLSECKTEIFDKKWGKNKPGGGGPGGGMGIPKHLDPKPPVPIQPPKFWQPSGYPGRQNELGTITGLTCPPWCKEQKVVITYHLFLKRMVWQRFHFVAKEYKSEYHVAYCTVKGCELGLRHAMPGQEGKQPNICFECVGTPGQNSNIRTTICASPDGAIQEVGSPRSESPWPDVGQYRGRWLPWAARGFSKAVQQADADTRAGLPWPASGNSKMKDGFDVWDVYDKDNMFIPNIVPRFSRITLLITEGPLVKC